jgi:hypothetical protein
MAIKKHKIRLMIIVGDTATDVARELIYTVLKEKINVRRNTNSIWWDLSVPLNILGYEDRRYTALGWLKTFVSVVIALLLNKSNPQLIILNADSANKSTVKYWTELVEPEYLVVLNYQGNTALTDEFVLRTINKSGTIVIPAKVVGEIPLLKKNKYKKIITYANVNSDLIIKTTSKGEIYVKYASEEKILNRKALPANSTLIAGAMFIVAAEEGISIDDSLFASLKYTFPTKLLSRIKTNLNNNQFTV